MKKSHIEAKLEEFLDGYSAEKNLAPTTIKLKKQIFKQFNLFCLKSPKPFGAEICRNYCNSMYQNGWTSDQSKNNVAKNVRAFIAFLYKRKYVTENFALEIEKPTVHRGVLDLVSEEMAEKIIIAGTTPGKGDSPRSTLVKKESRDALIFLLLSGLRIHEMIALRNTDLQLNDNPSQFIVKSKGGNSDIMECPRNAFEILKARENNPKVFKVNEETLREAMKRGCAIMEVSAKIRCHSLRHIFAISRLRKGEPLQKVSRLLRHSSIAITDRYYSHYVINDLSHTLNNTRVLQSGLLVETVANDIEKEARKNVDSRFLLDVVRGEKEMVLRYKWR